MAIDRITVRGARQHNLKDISVEIPRDRLTVITGLSGSGKSSLAFDTIYAEGQRRYVESLSAYARQFLDQLERPDVDSVDGLSPAISIEQKTVSRSPRSTVGTVTEVYDYLRLLFSSVGQPHCHICGAPITRQSVEQIVHSVLALPEGERVMVLAPVVRGRKGEFKKELEKLQKDGFLRARVDGELVSLDEEIRLDKRRNHTIEAVVDRLLIKPGISERLSESVRTALKLTGGAVLISVVDGEEKLYSERMACVNCGINVPPLEPRSFSFNSVYGACKRCHGLGTILEIDPARIITDATMLPDKLFAEFSVADKPSGALMKAALLAVIEHFKADPQTPFAELPRQVRDAFFHGLEGQITFRQGLYKYENEWGGAVSLLSERMRNAPTERIREALEELVSPVECPECKGQRLQPESLAVRVGNRGIAEYTALPIEDAVAAFDKMKLNEREEQIAGLVLREIRNRMRFLATVGLGYLTLDRASATLSGGEGQRIRLATQIGSQLRGVLYVLDEPSIGLHPRDNQKLLETLKALRDLGNTVLVVEHDEETIRRADYVVDLGPAAGAHGGEIVAAGTPEDVARNPSSVTGQYISGRLAIEVPDKRRAPNGNSVSVRGARANNLKSVDATFPLGLLTVVTGVSGSGKSTLVDDILYRALARHLYGSLEESGEYDSVEGLEHVDKCIEIDQSPIGRTPRSNPATYTGLFTPIRELYAMLPESRERGYKPGRFSFNVKGGRCEACEGDGLKRIEMNFLPDVYVLCDVCRGARYNRETLAVKYKGKSIADLLDTTIEEAMPLLENIPQIKQKLQTLLDVGLGYIKLGQSATTLSGGEAQRIKLARELSKRATGRTIYILDEPTTGLHFADVHKLLDVLQRLVSLGNTVIVIEHNLDVIKSADHIIDLGPEGGSGGGRVVASGTPEDVAKVRKSHTGQALRPLLNGHAANGNGRPAARRSGREEGRGRVREAERESARAPRAKRQRLKPRLSYNPAARLFDSPHARRFPLPRLRLAARTLLLSSIFAAACCMSVLAQEEPPTAATPEPTTTTQEHVYTREEVTKPAVILSMPEPVLQRKLGKTFDVSGTVKVEIVLTSSGKVGDVKVVEGLSKAQNFASVKAAHRITFMPAMKDGLPVSQSYVAEYRFTMTTNEFGKPEELKGLKKFYVDTWGDRTAREELTGELLRLMPSLELVDRTEQADCVILYSPYARMEQPFNTDMKGRVHYETPKRVRGGRGWAVKPLAADRQRVILYYEDMKYSFVEREPVTNFARAFVDAYKKANGLPK